MLEHFAGPIEFELPVEAVVAGLLFILVAYCLAIFIASWLVSRLVAFYSVRYAPATTFSKSLRNNGRVKSFTYYLFLVSFISTLALLYGTWPYFDTLGDIASVALFTLTALIVPVSISIALFTIKNK